MSKSERKAVEDLSWKLWHAVETHQGYFFVSDGETFATKAEFFERVRGRLRHGKEAVRKMEAFLRKHKETEPTS